MTEVLSLLFITTGLGFYAAGSIGLLRLPDLYTRLHGLTKADNLGLGMIVIGLALLSGSAIIAIKLLLIWILVLAASAASAHLIAQQALRGEQD
jgi:multicomponent Na+:H+ antiporter subunit G